MCELCKAADRKVGSLIFLPGKSICGDLILQNTIFCVPCLTSGGLDWQREKWKGGFGAKYIRLGEKMAVKHADEIIVLSKSVQEYFRNTYNRETKFIPNGVNRPKSQKADLIKKEYSLNKDDYILYLGRIVPEKGEHYLVEAFKKIHTDKKLVIAGGASDTDEYAKPMGRW